MSDLPPQSGWPTAPPGEPGTAIVGFPDGRAYGAPVHRISHVGMVVLLGIGLGILTGILIVVAVIAKPGPPGTCGRFGCQGRPVSPQTAAGTPERSGTTYSNQSGWSLQYYRFPFATSASTSAAGIIITTDWPAALGGPSKLGVFGASAGGATDSTIVNNDLSSVAPNAQFAYNSPQPLIGYEPGVGGVFENEESSSDGSTGEEQVVINVAQVNGFAISVIEVGADIGPVTPKSRLWNDHATSSHLNVSFIVDPIVNHILFPSS